MDRLKFDQNTGKAKGFGFCHYFGKTLFSRLRVGIAKKLQTAMQITKQP